ncbi:MAG: hypothetical protein HYZ13_14110 [Acidobacteria bacterium]|nr:hypothetical protein [Acidobacteriota bacterium]
MPDVPPLPHGVKKLDLQTAVLTFLDDKLFYAIKGSTEHVTVQFGPHSKQLDVHRTRRTTGGIEDYETLLRIPHDRLAPLLESVGKDFLPKVWSLFRPLRIGWMARHRIGAEPAFFPVESDWEQITTVRKKRLYVDAEKLVKHMGKLDYLEDLLDLPDGRAFSLISYKKAFKIIGFGIKVTDSNGRPRLRWCSNRRLRKEFTALLKRHIPSFEEAMTRSAQAEIGSPHSD